MHFQSSSERNTITIPLTFIKCPGSLVSGKTPLTKSASSPSSFQSLLQEFKVKSEAKQYPIDDIAIHSSESSCSSSSLGFLVKRYSSLESMTRPGEMKKASDDSAELVQLAQKLVSSCGINLNIRTCNTSSRKLQSVLKFLVPEVCSFASQFFKKLNITELTLFEGNDGEHFNSSMKATSFSIEDLDTESKVIRRLHEIVFAHILAQNPEKGREYVQSYQNDDFGFEKVFMALMRNSQKAVLKRQTEELRRWLSKVYPELTEEWFQNRNTEKKKLARVSFSC